MINKEKLKVHTTCSQSDLERMDFLTDLAKKSPWTISQI